jgi:prephenate dehydratase
MPANHAPGAGAKPRYAYLGPAGTFTEAALRQVVAPDDATYLPQADVVSAIESVREGLADFAVVAIENSIEGGVSAVLDTLAEGAPLAILREVLVPVAFALAGPPGENPGGLRQAPIDGQGGAIRRIAAHPHAWAQCRRWTRRHLPGAQHVPATSNTAPAAAFADAAAAGLDPAAARAKVGFDAALVPPSAVEHYGLAAIAQGVADNPAAVTRFVLVGRPGALPARTGADKTTLQVHLPAERAGALREMLEHFATRGINLTRIESRPSGVALGRYSFSIDAEGHIEDARMAEALVGLHRFSPLVRFLGSYPRADAAATQLDPQTTDEAFAAARAWLEAVRSGGGEG